MTKPLSLRARYALAVVRYPDLIDIRTPFCRDLLAHWEAARVGETVDRATLQPMLFQPGLIGYLAMVWFPGGTSGRCVIDSVSACARQLLSIGATDAQPFPSNLASTLHTVASNCLTRRRPVRDSLDDIEILCVPTRRLDADHAVCVMQPMRTVGSDGLHPKGARSRG